MGRVQREACRKRCQKLSDQMRRRKKRRNPRSICSFGIANLSAFRWAGRPNRHVRICLTDAVKLIATELSVHNPGMADDVRAPE